MERKTKAQLESMSAAELVSHYNVLLQSAGNPPIDRFASKPKGIARILKFYTDNPEPEPVAPPPPAVSESVRTVRRMTSERQGRPMKEYHVKITSREGGGTARVRAASLRGQILDVLRANGGRVAISKLEEQFGRKARGAVMKLMVVQWVEKEHLPEFAAAATTTGTAS